MRGFIFGVGLFLLTFVTCLEAQVLESYEVTQVGMKGGFSKKIPRAEVYVNLNTFPQSVLRIDLQEGTSLFVESRLLHHVKVDTTLHLPLVSLVDTLPQSGRDTVALIFLNQALDLDRIKVNKGYFQDELQISEKVAEDQLSSTRDRASLEEFFVLVALLIIGVLAIFRSVNYSVLSSMLHPGKLFDAEEVMESSFVSKVFSASTVFYMLVLSMAFALIGIVFLVLVHPLGVEVSTDLNTLLFYWLVGILIFLAIGYLKFFWIKIIAFIFRLEVVEGSQFMFMLRVVSIIGLLVFSALLFIMTNYPLTAENHISLLARSMFFVYLTGVVMFLIVAQKSGSFKLYHLFSYICTSELIPFLVITQFLMR
ncbi:DUF4271 domain-containing protein [Pleomorphovibrio marinus]|uniref:DUF4271 domain-containing protein n=1 Tax=Pleomorphovibrio marinus TaxID=2164132 RepID=UPI000E0B572F|nr:DUF4271 domain-containing protein [Pleomorphovibrio marinus]